MTGNPYLVIDLEATCCDQGAIPRPQMEIIEIGAVLVEGDALRSMDEFQSFVRPVRNPMLTPFCKRLTSIAQSDVDHAPGFGAVIGSFRSWLYQYSGFTFCSWGDYDLHQLQQDCAFHNVPYPISGSHLNLKRQLVQRQGLRKKPGLGQALNLAGLGFLGTAHRGIDDARNIVRLLPFIFGDDCFRAPAKRD